jgi:hypothetical protein
MLDVPEHAQARFKKRLVINEGVSRRLHVAASEPACREGFRDVEIFLISLAESSVARPAAGVVTAETGMEWA